MSRSSVKFPSKISLKNYEKPGISEEEILEIREVFDLFDHDGKGDVRPKELKEALDSLGPEAQNQTLYQMIVQLCDEGTNIIGFEEFLDLMTSRISNKDSRENVRKVFSMFDEQRTGFISLKDLRKITRELGDNVQEPELEEMINKADLDHDGLVSEEEFYLIITKKT